VRRGAAATRSARATEASLLTPGRGFFFWQSVGEKQGGTAEEHSVSKVVEAVPDVEGNVDENRQVDNQDHEQNHDT
jgi:hypothetical protein